MTTCIRNQFQEQNFRGIAMEQNKKLWKQLIRRAMSLIASAWRCPCQLSVLWESEPFGNISFVPILWFPEFSTTEVAVLWLMKTLTLMICVYNSLSCLVKPLDEWLWLQEYSLSWVLGQSQKWTQADSCHNRILIRQRRDTVLWTTAPWDHSSDLGYEGIIEKLLC